MNVWAVFILLQLADICLSLLGSSVGIVEKNPIVKWIIGEFDSALIAMLVTKSIMGLFLFAISALTKRTRIVFIANVFYLFVFLWNIFVLAGM